MVILLNIRYIIYNFEMIQLTIFLLWGALESLNLINNKREVDLGLHGLTALIPPLLSETQGALPYARNICNLDLETTTLILNGIRFGLILLSLYFLG